MIRNIGCDDRCQPKVFLPGLFLPDGGMNSQLSDVAFWSVYDDAKILAMPAILKVLTFGWEFPPHISGGLGTACHGLTSALLELGTDILFVVPKAHGDEDVSLIDAGKYISSGRATQPPYTSTHSVE